jgi:glycosyltransferase involved in cell wall biosynthesis
MRAGRDGTFAQMTRILHVVNDGELGGGQLMALELIEGLREHGYDGALASPSEGAFTGLARGRGVEVTIVGPLRLFRLDSFVRLGHAVRATGAGLLHTHTALAASGQARAIGRTLRVPVVAHLHAPNVFRPNRGAAGLYRRLDNLTARGCAAIVAVSEHTRADLVRQGYPAGAVAVIPNGIRIPADTPAAAPAELAGRSGLVVCVGRIEPLKGQSDLVAALPHAPAAVAVLVGRDVGGEAGRLRELAGVLGVSDRLVILGAQAQILPLLRASEVVAIPSRREAFGLVALEAMAAGRPVVASAVGGLNEVVEDGATGVLVPPGSPARLGAALDGLLGDPSLRDALGLAGRRRLEERFTAERMVGAVADLYGRVLRP